MSKARGYVATGVEALVRSCIVQAAQHHDDPDGAAQAVVDALRGNQAALLHLARVGARRMVDQHGC